MHRTAMMALGLGLLLTAVAPAPARAGFLTSYSVTLDAGYSDVTNILILERAPSRGSSTWAFTAYGDDARANTTRIDNPFESPEPYSQALLIGLTKDLPGDAPGQEHVVLMMDNTAASLAHHIAWGTLFRTTLEADIIDAIKLATSGQDWSIIQPGLDALDAFVQGDAESGILGPGGVPRSTWFGLGGGFTVMSFSEGQIIGTGTSEITFVGVPEPASIVLAAGGLLGVLGFARRRSTRRA